MTRAYYVRADDYEVYEIYFVERDIEARRAAMDEFDIEEMSSIECKRVPELDKYAGVKGGIPPKTLMNVLGFGYHCENCCGVISGTDPIICADYHSIYHDQATKYCHLGYNIQESTLGRSAYFCSKDCLGS